MANFAAFISYAKADAKKAEAIAKALESKGFKCWIAPRDVKPGAAYGDEIIRGIESARSFMLVLSKASQRLGLRRPRGRAGRSARRSRSSPCASPTSSRHRRSNCSSPARSGSMPSQAGSAPISADLPSCSLGRQGEPAKSVDRDVEIKPRPTRRWVWPVSGAAALLVVIGTGIAFWPRHEAVPDRTEQADNPLDTKPVSFPKPDAEASTADGLRRVVRRDDRRRQASPRGA